MTCLDEFGRTNIVFVTFVFLTTFQGAACQLLVSPLGSSRVTSMVGDNVTLAILITGASNPAVAWFMGNVSVIMWTMNSATTPVVAESLMKVVRLESDGSLTLLNVTLNLTSSYTVEMTKPGLSKAVTSFTLTVFERPAGDPVCFVQMESYSILQYQCQWPGGTPQANLTFPQLSSTDSGGGNVSVTITASSDLNGKAVTCIANHPTGQKTCNITAKSPADFLPAVRSTAAPNNQTVVSISCVGEASPKAVVTWSNGRETLSNGTNYQINLNTTQLQIQDYVGNILLHNYSCTCFNPLGNQTREVQLQVRLALAESRNNGPSDRELRPSISPSSLVCNKDGTSVSLSWETLPTSVVTGFDIQMMGSNTNRFSSIQQQPGTARGANISGLNPHLTYRVRVIPKAPMVQGPSMDCKISGSNDPVIAGVAAGIPCSILFLLLLGGLIYLYVYCNRRKSRQPRYPVSRAADKAVTPHSVIPHNHMRRGGLKCPPDYNRTQQTSSERSGSLPTFAPPPPVRVATTV